MSQLIFPATSDGVVTLSGRQAHQSILELSAVILISNTCPHSFSRVLQSGTIPSKTTPISHALFTRNILGAGVLVWCHVSVGKSIKAGNCNLEKWKKPLKVSINHSVDSRVFFRFLCPSSHAPITFMQSPPCLVCATINFGSRLQ